MSLQRKSKKARAKVNSIRKMRKGKKLEMRRMAMEKKNHQRNHHIILALLNLENHMAHPRREMRRNLVLLNQKNQKAHPRRMVKKRQVTSRNFLHK